nr:hypothetical protein BaRGS_030851 [Batillaria attramentaria]
MVTGRQVEVAECAALVRRLTAITLDAILSQLPIDILHDALPASPPRAGGYLCQGSGGEEKNCNLHVPCCRSILRVVMATEPNFRRTVAQMKARVGQVLAEDGPTRSVVFDLQVTRSDVQERIIKNKTLLNVVEPAAHNLHLARLLRTLRARIEYDKLLLFHDTELRKMGASSSSRRLAAVAESHTTSPHVPPSDAKCSASQLQHSPQMAATLTAFSLGYATLLRLIREVTEAQGEVGSEEGEGGESDSSGEEEEGGVVEGDADYLSVTSTLSVMKRMKVVSLNGLVPLKVKAGVLPASSGRVRNRLLGMQTTHTGSRGHRKEAGIQTTPIMESRAVIVQRTICMIAGLRCSNGQVRSMNMMSDLDSHNQGPAPSTTMLEQEILYLRQELSAARDQIRRLQDQEKQLRERLSDQVHQQFQLGNQQFEDLALGTQRPAELIRRYGDLRLDPLQDVSQQIYATLYDYPCLKACAGLLEYVSQCVRIVWGLCVQRAPYSLAYETHTFDSRVHTRFHTSDPDSDQIKSFLWPPLVDSDGECVSRGVVIT